ncbi:unnamed protein product [Taenia asiatica]|uniref:Uncharacterized protein n=1 Tax=Taenia asiatica TaxID=60517 RepID=A0A3P6Q1E0_TAEAS|nr:unnamed protein product [Taenia asiatica]
MPFFCSPLASPSTWRLGGLFLRHPFNLTAACNSVCRVRVYNNGKDELFSCPHSSDYNPIYTDCNCVTNTSLMPEGVHSLSGSGIRGTTKKGVCRPQCPRYAPFLIVTFLTIFLTSVNQNPSNVITLSCVAPEDGTAALGLQVFFSRTLAFIPTPIYFGALMDRTCRVRALPQRLICESQQHHLLLLSAPKLAPLEGACLEYDVHALPFAWLGGVTVFKCLSILIAILTWRYS